MDRNLETLVIVLAGGEGSRLHPLTLPRTKPAVPIGGKYRLIDIPLSNAANSGFRRFLILTQYKDSSLRNHILGAWPPAPRWGVSVDVRSPEELESKYLGDAHAVKMVRQQVLDTFPRPKYVVVAPGDHLLKMDYSSFLDFMIDNKGDAAVSIIPRDLEDAAQLGSLDKNDNDEIVDFREKDPNTPFRVPGTTDQFFASMGIYAFMTDALMAALDYEGNSFGKNIVPSMVNRGGMKVLGYDYVHRNNIAERIRHITRGNIEWRDVARSGDSAYWEDVGTIPTYFKANMDLVGVDPLFNLYGRIWKFYTSENPGGPVKNVRPHEVGDIQNLLVSEGAILSEVKGKNLVVSPDVFIDGGNYIDTIVFNNSVLQNCDMRRTIVDKDVRLIDFRCGYDKEEDRERHIFVHPDHDIRVITKNYRSMDPSTWQPFEVLYK